MQAFNCNSEWPVCLFDFTYKNRIPQYLCFRASAHPPIIIEDYFRAEHHDTRARKAISKSLASFKDLTTTEGLLIERGIHHCRAYPRFVHNFKALFNSGDNEVFSNPN